MASHHARYLRSRDLLLGGIGLDTGLLDAVWAVLTDAVPHAAADIASGRPVLDTRLLPRCTGSDERIWFTVRTHCEHQLVFDRHTLDHEAPEWDRALALPADHRGMQHWRLIRPLQNSLDHQGECAVAQWIAVTSAPLRD